MLILVLIVLVLSGCVSPQQRYAQTMNECQAIASQYNLGDAYQQFMHQCVNMQPSPVQAQQYFNQAATGNYGRADAFGPYGVWGPTWQEFNSQFQQPHRSTPLPPVR